MLAKKKALEEARLNMTPEELQESIRKEKRNETFRLSK